VGKDGGPEAARGLPAPAAPAAIHRGQRCIGQNAGGNGGQHRRAGGEMVVERHGFHTQPGAQLADRKTIQPGLINQGQGLIHDQRLR
jgi:hypothetical protein